MATMEQHAGPSGSRPLDGSKHRKTQDDARTPLAPGWIRATEDIREACNALAPGAVLTVPDVSMMDTVIATPLMDPRLDCGIVPMPRELVAACDIGGEAQEMFDANATLNAADICWILDRLFACEAAWLATESLASASLHQTIYTSLHLHHVADLFGRGQLPKTIEADQGHGCQLVKRILWPAVLGVISCTALVWTELIRGNLVDGEDYIGDRSGLQLCENLDPRAALAALADARQFIETASLPGKTLQIARGERDALLARLNFRHSYLDCLLTVAQTDSSLSFGTGQDILTLLGMIPHKLEAAKEDLHFCRSSERHALCDPAMRLAPSASARSSFNPWLARQMTVAPGENGAPVLPAFKPFELPPPEKSVGVFEQLLAGIETFRSLSLARDVWRDWKTYFDGRALACGMDFTCPYLRSIWQSAVCTSNNAIAHCLPLSHLSDSFMKGTASIRPGILSTTAFMPPLGRLSHDESLSMLPRRMAAFNERLAGQLVAHLRNLAQNRARGRRYLSHSYGDLLTLSDEADALSADLEAWGVVHFSPNVLRASVQLLALDTMQQIIFSSLELELLQSREISAAYWVAMRVVEETYAIVSELDAAQKYKQQQYAWRPNSSDAQPFLQGQLLWLNALFRACEAFYLLYQQGGTKAIRSPWSMEKNSAASNGATGGSNLLVKAAFMKRYSWLRVIGRPESSAQLEELWYSYSAEAAHLQSLQTSVRLDNAARLFKEAVGSLEALSKHDPQCPHPHAKYASELCENLGDISNACLEQAAGSLSTSTAHTQASLLPLRFTPRRKDQEGLSHPWFPVLDLQ